MSARDFSGRLLVPVMARPRRPLSRSASTDSCSMRFSLRTIMSGAFNSSRRRSRLLRLITRRYKSFRSEVAKRPPSSGTSGRRSGGNTGSTVMTIHSGLLPDSMNDSSNFNRLERRLIFVSDRVAPISSRTCNISRCKSIVDSISRTASAPILASNSSPYCSIASRYISSVINCPRSSGVMPGSTTTNASKYKTRSISRSVMSSIRPIRDGNDLRNQMCATGLARSMCAMRSRRTFVCVTSTPHFSHTTPRCLRRLYFPHRHS